MELLSIDGMPIKRAYPGIVDDPSIDSMLWSGLMCATGLMDSAVGIKKCQTKAGRMYRSPNHEVASGSFSRDMALGFLMYVAASGDNQMFTKWTDYLNEYGTLCDDAVDNRCNITAPIWWQIYHVRDRNGSPWYLRAYLYAAAKLSPVGYQLHLIGCHLLLNWQLDGCRDTAIGQILYKRQPRNPFFQWLAGEPVVIPSVPDTTRQTQWAWERSDDEEAWRDSMGWDIIFIENLRGKT